MTRARHYLTVHANLLRKALFTERPHALQYFDGTYRLVPDDRLWVDCLAFERLAAEAAQLLRAQQAASARDLYVRAAGLYQGEFLCDYPYDDKIQARRQRLRSIHEDCLQQLERAGQAAGLSGC